MDGQRAEVVLEGYSLARFAYCRHGFRGAIRGLLDHAQRRAHVQDTTTGEHEGVVTYSVRWA